MWYSNMEETFISRRILHQQWCTSLIALPVRRNPQHRRLLTVVSATSQPPFQRLHHQRNDCHPNTNRFTRQTHSIVNRKPLFMNILRIESFRPQNKRTTERYSSVFAPQARSPFWLLKLASEMRMRVWYLDCHEAGLCCSLVIRIQNILRPLQIYTSICELFTDSSSYKHEEELTCLRRLDECEIYDMDACPHVDFSTLRDALSNTFQIRASMLVSVLILVGYFTTLSVSRSCNIGW
jgi:hypothetical protein